MENMKKLPDAEFEVMQVVWANEPPITTSEVMNQLGFSKGWKIQMVVTFMLRLTEKGFLRSEKHGKERTYFPLVSQEDYLKFETGKFMKQFHKNSFLSLATTLYDNEALTDEEIDGFLELLKKRRG
jgi:predicted transcriptional regulator